MAFTSERKVNMYLDLLDQIWPNMDKKDQMRNAYTLGLSAATYSGSAATVRLDPLDMRTWNLDAGMIEKHVTNFETWFALASIDMNYASVAIQATGSNATLDAYGAPTFPAGGETPKR